MLPKGNGISDRSQRTCRHHVKASKVEVGETQVCRTNSLLFQPPKCATHPALLRSVRLSTFRILDIRAHFVWASYMHITCTHHPWGICTWRHLHMASMSMCTLSTNRVWGRGTVRQHHIYFLQHLHGSTSYKDGCDQGHNVHINSSQ